ncbi:MAG TPA: M56 family metallopeptidase [Planctomycetaceae bacterium]|jgi:beta-lactamase regulating signal transducer with metallopeptidase domain
MTPIGPDALAAALPPLVHATWQGGVLALVVLAVTRSLGHRMRASWRFALWLVVFARLATPWIPSAPWSLYTFLPHGEPRNDAMISAAMESRAGVTDELRRGVSVRDVDAAGRVRPHAEAETTAGASADVDSVRNPAMESVARVHSILPGDYLALVWLAGVMGLATRMGGQFVRLSRWRAAWQAAVDPALCTLFELCRGEARVQRVVSLRLTPSNIGPAACGVLSPTIVLPERLSASLLHSEMRFVLLHELIHVRRHDALIDFIASCIACVHWFNPAVWLALAGLRRERELACDAALLDLLGTSVSKDYGSVLLKSVETLQSAPAAAGTVAMIERPFFTDSLAGRIQMIANYRRTTRAGRAAGGMLVILLALLGLTDAAVRPAREAASVAVTNAGSHAGDTTVNAVAADASAPDDALPPVPAERPAAEKIRALGGWYALDADRHVIEVNMVDRYDSSGERHENEQKTDQALAHLAGFPRLKRLMMCETQVSDDGLEFVGRLPELEELFIWDGATITDKGVAHLRTLRKLKFLLLGSAAITDEAVAHLSHVSSIETLLLDSNGLTDKSLEYASKLPSLRELEVGNWAPESRQARITPAGLEHVRKMPALKRLGIPLIPTAVDDLKPLHGLAGLELLTIEDVLFQGEMGAGAIVELQKATPQLKVSADRKIYPSVTRIAAGADPQQQKTYRKEGAEGLKVIERFLALMWAKQDDAAAQLGNVSDEIAECRRFRREPGFVPFKVSMAYGDSGNVLAITEPPVTYKLHELHDGARREIGKQTAHVLVSATRSQGTWRVKGINRYVEEPGADALFGWFQPFLQAYPGAQALLPSTPSKP